MIENGKRYLSKRSQVIAVATILGVSPVELVGQPRAPRTQDEWEIYKILPAVRVALDELPPADFELWDPARIQSTLDTAAAARMACDYALLGELLPRLIEQTQVFAERSVAGQRLLCRAAGQAALTVKPFGHVDLAMRLADRAQRAAEASGDALEGAFAGYVVAQCALGAGLRRRSLGTAVEHAAQLEGDERPDALAARGMLHLHAAYAGASQRTSDYEAHFAEAAALAARVSADPWRFEFTPANVAVWRVGIALENGVPERAPGYARLVRRDQLRTKQRRARLHLDWGRALFLEGQPHAAVRQLLEADAVAPAEVRFRATAREMVGQIIRDHGRAGGFPELLELSTRMGIDPLAPLGSEF